MKKLFIFGCLLIGLLLARPAKGVSVSVMGSTNLNLWGQTVYQQAAFWYEYTGGDAQQDKGFVGVFSAGPYTNLAASIQLGTTMPAGTYSLLLKTSQYPNGGLYPTYNLLAGDANVSWAYLDRAATGLGGMWSLPTIFTSSTTFSNVTLNVGRTFPTNETQQLILIGLHINSITNVVVDKFDRIVDLTVSGTVTSNTVAGNYLDNASFELGMDRGWWNETSDARTNNASMVSTAHARTGTRSVQVLFGEAVCSRLYHVRPNATYVVSAWAKTTSGTRSVRLGVVHPFASFLPTGYTSPFPTLQTTTVGTNWTRIYATNVVREAAGSRIYVKIEATSSATNTIFVDDVQLEEAPAPTTFALRSPIEIAVGTTNALAVYVDGESNATFRAYNSGTSTPLTLGYETRDYLNTVVATGTVSMTASNGLSEVVRGIHPGRRGSFSLLVTNSEALSDELSFSVVPSPRNLGTNSAVGSHGTVNRGDYYIEGTRRTGGSWFRGLSHAGFFRWDMLEPSNGTWDYSWSDQQMSRVTNNANVQLLGVLYARPSWCAQVPVTADWLEYVTNVVTRYSPVINYWEIDNEPNVPMTPAQYVIMLTNTVNAIKSIQPSARILAMGGVTYPSWASSIMTLLPTNYLTNVYGVSIHVYPAVPSTAVIDTVRSFVSIFAPYKVWASEAGNKSAGRRLGLDANFLRYSGSTYTYKDSLSLVQDLTWATDGELQCHLNSLGLGCEVVINYDSRLPANAVSDHQWSDIDIDDSIKTKGTQRATLAWIVDGTTNRFEASHAGIILYAFQRADGVMVAGHYATTNNTLTVTTTLTNQFWTVDSMGNLTAPAGSTFRASHRVQYLVATNATWSAWTNALATATQVAWTDTNSPAIVMLPTDSYSGKNVATWVAIDDNDFPLEHTPNVVLYSYRTNGSSWSSWSGSSYLETTNAVVTVEARAKDAAGNISATVLRSFGVTPPPTLLILTEPTARSLAGYALDKVIAEDRRAGWNVHISELPRWTGTWATNDWNLLNAMKREVDRFCTSTNDAVIVFGRLPFLQTGGHNDDGHYLRRVTTDGWLGCSGLTFTDTSDWMALGMDSSDIMASNRVADGFPDNMSGTLFVPVTRIDASAMGAAPTNYVFAAGYLAGQVHQPAINEGYWLRNYLTNVWQYQTRQWTVSETGFIDTQSSAWATGSSGIQSANSAITWTASTDPAGIAGGTWRFLYDGLWPEVFSPYLITSGGVPTRAFWIVTHKSYEMDMWDSVRHPMRRLCPGVINQPFSLVASWCKGNLSTPYFRSRSSDSTVFDVIRSSAAGTVDFRYNVYGWGTLTVVQPTATKRSQARVTSLTIQ